MIDPVNVSASSDKIPLPVFHLRVFNADNEIFVDVPYGALENFCRSVLFNGNNVEVLSHSIKTF